MADSKDKKKSPVIFFVVGFALIVLVTLIANRQSPVRKVQFKFNNGVSELSTYSHFLVAVSQDAKLYIWDWRDLSKKPKTGEADSDQALLLSPDTVLSVKRTHADTVVISEVANRMNRKLIPLASEYRRALVGSNTDRSTAVVLLEKPGSPDGGTYDYELLRLDCKNLRYEHIAEIIAHQTSRLLNPVVSDDGQLVLLMGEKEKNGWMILVNMTNKAVVQDKLITNFERFESAEFSPDGRFIYARGCDSTLYKIQTSSADVVERWPSKKKNKSTLGQTSIQKVRVSPDGRVVASIVFADVYMWDSNTGKVILKRTPKHKIESGLAFSPDGRFVATSDLRQGGTIKIWRVPKY